jgi:hypothetical protein
VAASPEVIWAAFQAVTEWPHHIKSFEAVTALDDKPLAIGARFQAKQPGLAPLQLTVTVIEPGRGFVWECHRPGATIRAEHWIENDGIRLRFSLTGLVGQMVGVLARKRAEGLVRLELQGFKDWSEGR